MFDHVSFLTAVGLLVAGVLITVGGVLVRLSARVGVPVALLFLIVGMVAGSDISGGIDFEDYPLSYTVGTLALVLILFAGGLGTDLKAVRPVAAPALVLATVGVLGVAALATLGTRLAGYSWTTAALFGAIVSSTDAAAVFVALRGVRLRGRVAPTLELESGLNDPMAVILTTTMAALLVGKGADPLAMTAQVLWQLIGGIGFGLGLGWLYREILRRVRLPGPTLYPLLTVSLAFVAYGLTTLCQASGFLAAYLAGLFLAGGPLPYRAPLVRFHDSLGWLAQVAMFLLLGLLVYPRELPRVALPGVGLALFLAFVARPAVVFACLAPFRYPWREMACIAWLGLRGAVPIILATIPVLAATPGVIAPQLFEAGKSLFNLVFFVVVVGLLVPGATIRLVTRWLGLDRPAPPEPAAAVDIGTRGPTPMVDCSIWIAPDSPIVGKTLRDLALPGGALVVLLVRGEAILPPRGGTVFQGGDHAFVICREEDAPAVHAAFGVSVED
jgi:cell volume regulation protein A